MGVNLVFSSKLVGPGPNMRGFLLTKIPHRVLYGPSSKLPTILSVVILALVCYINAIKCNRITQ